MTDLLVINARVRTMDPARPTAEKVACSGGLIESLDEAPEAKRTFDAKGHTVVPGFICGPYRIPVGGFLKIQRSAIPMGITGIQAVVDDEALREVLSMAEGRALRLRVNASFRPPDEAKLLDFMRSREPITGRLSVRRLLATGDMNLDSLNKEGRSKGWEVVAMRDDIPSGEDLPDSREQFASLLRGGMDPGKALHAMTASAADVNFMESGVIAPGRPADMVVLSHDWLTCSVEDVAKSEVLATMMDGRIACLSPKLR